MTSTAIYTCYRQLHPPTGVDHAVFGSITAAGSHDLVVAKASILELYRVHRVSPDNGPTGAAAAGRRGGGNNATAGADAAAGAGGAAFRGGANDDDYDDDESSFFLELAGTFPIAGTITSLAVIPVVGDQQRRRQHRQRQRHQEQHILVVSFGPAKMALVAYDSLLGRLGTLSIHNFDAEAIGPGADGVESGYGLASALKDRPATISSSDPSGRCLAAIVAGCQLVVLPTRRHVPSSVFVSEEARRRAQQLRRRRRRIRDLRRRGAGAEGAGRNGNNAGGGGEGRGGGNGGEGGAGGVSDAAGGGEGDGSIANGGQTDGGPRLAVLKPFTINLEEAGFTGFIKAATFLEGFHEPALAILYEPIQTYAGRLASKRSTCRLVLLSVNLTQGRAPVIWQVDNLPHDSWDLIAVPSPIGGVQVRSVS
ncbi:unnamed protein product, partial [Laminaria digitata]